MFSAAKGLLMRGQSEQMDRNCLCLWLRRWWSAPPPPSSLCPQINSSPHNSETKRSQQTRRGPGRRPPPLPPQWTVCQPIVQLGGTFVARWLSFPAYKGIKHRAAELFKLDEEIGVIILPTVFESERRPELLFGCLLIDQRSERAARSSWWIPLTTPPLTCFLSQSPTVRTPPFSARHRHQKWTPQAIHTS